MTPEQVENVQATVWAIEADPGTFATRFYERLFSLDPPVRELFPDDMSEQKGKVVEEVVFLAHAASDLDGFTLRARELGSRHRHYGVRAGHYPTVERAMLGALADLLGEAWGPDTEEAWQRLYRLVAETMLEGASGELFSTQG